MKKCRSTGPWMPWPGGRPPLWPGSTFTTIFTTITPFATSTPKPEATILRSSCAKAPPIPAHLLSPKWWCCQNFWMATARADLSTHPLFLGSFCSQARCLSSASYSHVAMGVWNKRQPLHILGFWMDAQGMQLDPTRPRAVDRAPPGPACA